MAGLLLFVTRILLLFFFHLILVSSGSINKSVQNVPEPLIQSALNSLNKDSPTHHTYKGGNLINAQKLEEPPYVIYRLTFDLTPDCKEPLEPCPREACTVEIKQHEHGNINVLRESIQCMYLYPQSVQDDPLQVQENNQEQEMIDNLEKQIINNQSIELDHEIQNNRDHSERPFIAMRAPNSTYCPGCPYELNPNLPGLSTFGEQVAKSMDELIQNDFKHKVIGIVKVTSAIPPSSNVVQYQILFHIGESDCLKNAIDQAECSVQLNLPVKTCLVTFEEQPWKHNTRKITKNNCTIDNNLRTEENVSSYSILNVEALVTAAPNNEETNPEKLEALENLKNILNNYTYATTAKTEEPEQSEVTEQSPMKVSISRDNDDTKLEGFGDKTKEFGEFLKDFDLPTREIQSNPVTNKEEVKEEIILPKKVDATKDKLRKLYRNKRKSDFVNVPKNIDINDPEVQQFVHKGLQKFSENSEGTNEPMVVEIVEATKQVVSGLLYKIKVKLGTSTCAKGTKVNCQLIEESELKECLFTIWSQSWIDHGNPRISIDCGAKNQRRKRSIRGAQYSLKMLKMAEDYKDELLFEDFVKTHNKTYLSVQEKADRYKIFKKNLKIIEKLRKFEQGTAEYGVTMFADLTPKEFQAKYLGLKINLKQENDIPLQDAEIPDIDLPPKFDWRKYNIVTPIKDQGPCGSCWAFSVTGNIEGQYALKHNKLLSLSEQELVDCDNLDDGCGGGEMTNAYKSIENLGGLELETDYPYDAKNEKCNFDKNRAKVQVVSAVNITSDEKKMAQWLVKNGPISIGINANAMQFYFGGVSHPFKFLCNPRDLDHAVLIVGYGTTKYPLFNKELPYWIIKNSWGKHWGEQGYYRLYRGDGTCGVNAMPSSAIVV